MKKLLLLSIIALCSCTNSETKKENGLDSLSASIDSARAHDTLLLKLCLQDSINLDTSTIKTKIK